MVCNPFSVSSERSTPLRLEVCQRIHTTALAAVALKKGIIDEIPSTIDPIAIQQHARHIGNDAYLLHPMIIEQCFTGVTLEVYLSIQKLYCSRIERRISMIWIILNAMAQRAHAPSLSYEAVWAICVSLQDQRRRMTGVSVVRIASTWWITLLPEEARTDGEDAFSSLVCVFDETSRLVMAFRTMASSQSPEAVHLALYDALVLHRHPSRNVPSALTWYLPERLIVDAALPFAGQQCCAQLGLHLERQCRPLFAQTLHQKWKHEAAVRHLKPQRWLPTFDSYLHKVCGYSPCRLREQRDQNFASLIGYTRDPSWNLPALRMLLPCYPAIITAEGTIIYQRTIYQDELLMYWPDTPVTIRPSEPEAAALWVYLDGEVLCQATAQTIRQTPPLSRTQRER